MNRTERSDQHPRTHATLPAFLRADGAAAPAAPRNLLRLAFLRAACALLVAVVACLALVSAAHAATIGQSGEGAGQLSNPRGIAVDQESGDFYVVDSANQRVDKFSAQGDFLLAFGWGVADGGAEPQTCTTTCRRGIEGQGSGQFEYPNAVAVDNDPASPSFHDLYVTDNNNYRVEKFSPSGEFLLTFGGEVDKTTNANVCTAASGDQCGAGLPGTGASHFYAHLSPPTVSWQDGSDSNSVAVGPGGTVYVGDFERVQKFTPAGAYAGQLSLLGDGFASALALDSSGDLFTRNLTRKRNGELIAEVPGVREFDPSGSLIRTLDADGTPQGLAVNAGGELIVRDSGGGDTHFLTFDSSGLQVASFRPPTDIQFSDTGALAYGQAADLVYATGENDDLAAFPPPPPGPLVQSGSEEAAEVLSNSATLDAIVNPQNHATTFHFEYGTTASYGHETPESAPIGEDFTDRSVSQTPTDLQPETTYHFRVVATNSRGTVKGEDQTFTTQAPVAIDPQAPAALTATTATLQTYLNPLGEETNCHFEYGPTESYGSTAPCQGPSASGTEPLLQAAEVSALSPATTYHFRLLATNALATVTGPDSTFTTPPLACPNQALREENDSTVLPDCRAYEQVSPLEKGGYGVTEVSGLAPSGDRVWFQSQGVFAGDPLSILQSNYLAQRGADGWTTAGIDPPPSVGYYISGTPLTDPNSDLSEFGTQVLRPTSNQSEAGVATVGAVFLRHPDGSFTQASPQLRYTDGAALSAGLEYSGASADLSHLLFSEAFGKSLLPEFPGIEGDTLYELSGATGAAAQLRVVNLDDSGNELLPCSAKSIQFKSLSQTNERNRISADGSTIFFTARSPDLPGGCASSQLLARVDGQHTFDLSDPQPNAECTTTACLSAPLSGALAVGASADGSKAFFVSTRQLTDSASQGPVGDPSNPPENHCSFLPDSNGCNLYMYDFNRPTGHNLLDLSAGDTSGQGPHVQAVETADDGSHVYFVARGLLTGRSNSLGQLPRAGAENLYVYDTGAAKLTFIADLCSGTELSGNLGGIAQCPGSGNDIKQFWNGGRGTDFTTDGRFLLFTTYAQLTPDDQNQAADVYRYDALAGSLARISIGHEGEDQNGNGGGQDAIAGIPRGGAGLMAVKAETLSEDASTIAFTTARPLQGSDSNGVDDVYEWHDGQVSLLSGGTVLAPVAPGTVAVSRSGHDIFFTTSAGLIKKEDTDELRDVYDVHIDGGFPLRKPGPVPCESTERCHLPLAPVPPPPTIGSEENRHGLEPLEKPCKKGFVKKHGKCVKVRKHQKKHHHKRAANTDRRAGK